MYYVKSKISIYCLTVSSVGGICRSTKNAEISQVKILPSEPRLAGLLVSFLLVRAYRGSTLGRTSRLGSTMGPIRRGLFALNPGIGSNLFTLKTVLVTCSPCSTVLSGEFGRCCFLHFCGGQYPFLHRMMTSITSAMMNREPSTMVM